MLTKKVFYDCPHIYVDITQHLKYWTSTYVDSMQFIVDLIIVE